MKILQKAFLLCLLPAIIGCEGMIPINPKYQPTGMVNCVTQGRPVIELQVKDERVKKVFHRSPGFGEVTEDGSGGPYKLVRTAKQIVEQAFSTALRACNYEIKDNSEIIYQVDIEEFIIIQHKPDDPIFGIDSKQETNIVLNIAVVSSGQSLAWKRFVQKDTAKFLSEQNIVEKMLSRSLSAVVEEALAEHYFADVINEEFMRISEEWTAATNTNTEHAYQDFIQDISAGGVFIETHMPFSVRQQVSLAFALPDYQKHVKITGEIVRSSPEGIAVKFKMVNQDQEAMIKSLLEMI